jgi:ribosomal protein S18 acetylase RimI-like enzyme
VLPSIPVPQFNGVWPLDDASASALEGALGEVAELGLPYSVQVRAGKTPAAEREAERLGLKVAAVMPGMLVEPDGLTEDDGADLLIRRVDTAAGLAEALGVAAEGFGAPPELFARLYGPEIAAIEGLVIYIGRVGNDDVTTGVGLTIGDAVGVFTIATPPAHRGRGYGAAITAQVARDGFEAGARIAYLQSSALGLSVYRRLGFREVESYVMYAEGEH